LWDCTDWIKKSNQVFESKDTIFFRPENRKSSLVSLKIFGNPNQKKDPRNSPAKSPGSNPRHVLKPHRICLHPGNPDGASGDKKTSLSSLSHLPQTPGNRQNLFLKCALP
jgi:hypothetical protein